MIQLPVERKLEIGLTVLNRPFQSRIHPFIPLIQSIPLINVLFNSPTDVASSSNEAIQLTTYVFSPEIDSIQLITQAASENIDSNQSMTQVGSHWIQIKSESY